ncbi:hypothetical protein GCM10009665_12440 [Kitasatospora nipponensis]|uniref:Uncharacterized protein n=1 Tax=Kitasatospora nipponensis TaxID=258049 RepID=A0ABP4GFG7_9ACTN
MWTIQRSIRRRRLVLVVPRVTVPTGRPAGEVGGFDVRRVAEDPAGPGTEETAIPAGYADRGAGGAVPGRWSAGRVRRRGRGQGGGAGRKIPGGSGMRGTPSGVVSLLNASERSVGRTRKQTRKASAE